MDLLDQPSFGRGILEAAPDPILVVDERGQIVVVNGRTLEIFGFTRDELVGRPVETLVPSRLRDAHARQRHEYERAPQIRRMGAATSRFAGCRKDRSEFPIEISLSPFVTTEGRFTICIIRDVSDRLVVEQRLRYFSTHDGLTGLYNRAFFDEEVARLERGYDSVGIVIADLDGLKDVNDRLGHPQGDHLLQRAALLLSAAFRAGDVVARIGGDEFGALLPAVERGALESMVSRLRSVLTMSQELPPLCLSLGIATGSPGALTTALRAADSAMYADKRSRRLSPPR